MTYICTLNLTYFTKVNTSIQCNIGFRVAKIIQRLGITEDQFESFMSDVYDKCQKLEPLPKNYII